MNFEYTVKKVSIESRLKIPTAKIDKYLWLDGKEIQQIVKEVDELSNNLHEVLEKLHMDNPIQQKMVQQIAIVKKERRKYTKRVPHLKQKIVNFMVEKNDWVTNDNIQTITGGAHNTINANLNQLISEGTVKVNKTQRPARYHIVVSNQVVKPLEPTSL